jgi:uncharacterized protein with beta-barrel porin domain
MMSRRTSVRVAAIVASPAAWLLDASEAYAQQVVPAGFYQSQTSLVVPYINGTMNYQNSTGAFGNRAATLNISIAGSPQLSATMDTGSTGIVVSQCSTTFKTNCLPSSLLNNYQKHGQGATKYTSSQVTLFGTFYQLPINILGGVNTATNAAGTGTTLVKVLVLEDGAQAPYMGIGNNRNNVYSGSACSSGLTTPGCTQISAVGMNPFINVDIDGAALPNQGYVVMNNQVVIGLTAQNNGYSFISLAPDPANNPQMWGTIPMTISAIPGSGNGPETGDLLPDTGIDHAYLNPYRSDIGSYTVNASLPGISPQQAAFYSFINDPSSSEGNCTVIASNAMQPCYQGGGTSSTGFINTGRQFYSGFNYLFDPVNGFAGFALSSSGLPTTATITPMLALAGTVALPAGPAGLGMALPVFLYGNTTLTTTPGATVTFTAPVNGFGNNLMLSSGGIFAFTAPVNLGSGTFSLQPGTAATIAAGLTAQTLGVSAQSTLTNLSGSSISVQNIILDGSLVGNLRNTGTLSGNGTLTGNLLNSGIIAPGNSIGTLSINGNYAQPGGTIAAEIQGPQNDLIHVTGNVTNFTGTANLIPYGGGSPFPGFVYTILSAPNSIDFATAGSLTLVQPQLTSALLNTGTTLVQNPLGDPKSFAIQWKPNNSIGAVSSAMQALGNAGANASSVAGALDRAFQALATTAAGNSNNTGALIGSTGFTTGQVAAAGMSTGFFAALNNLVQLPSTSQLVAAVNSLSPQSYAAFQSVGLDTLKQQREAVLAQTGQCLSNGWVINGTKAKKPLCAFGLAQNNTSTIRGTSDLSAYNSGVFSGGLGLEYYPSKQWSFGGSYSYGTSYANNFSSFGATVTAGVNSINLFGTFAASDQWRVRGLLSYSNFNINGSRSIAFIGNGSSLSANTNANGFTAALETDYAIPLTKPSAQTQVVIKPLLGFAWGGYQQSGFSESGGPLSLSVNSNTANSFVTTAGLELSTSPIPLNKDGTVSIRPNLLLAYQVDALANNAASKSLNSTFAEASSVCATCSTQGQNLGMSALNVAGSVDVQVSPSTSFYVNASYRAYSNASQFGYGGGVRVKF